MGLGGTFFRFTLLCFSDLLQLYHGTIHPIAPCYTRLRSNYTGDPCHPAFMGCSGAVIQAYTGNNDNGAQINGEALASFQYHGGMNLKRYTMMRPVYSVENNTVGLVLGLNLDFNQTAPTGTPTVSTSTAGIWGTGVWGTFTWGGGYQINTKWQSVGGVGYCAAAHIKVSSKSSGVKWQSVDYVFEQGFGIS